MATSSNPGRIVVTQHPLNCEVPLPALAQHPSSSFFVRCNFDIPALDRDGYRLKLGGLLGEPAELDLAALRAAGRARAVHVVLECAGNGRALVVPQPPGTPWHLGAVSSAVFAGVRLRDVLLPLRPDPGVREIVFAGHDAGDVDDGGHARFERSLPLAEALRDDVLLAWDMNGEALPPEHGAPLRLVVPGWYGIASVKWLAEVRATAEPFAGYFQRQRYVFHGDPAEPDGAPVTRMRVRSLILDPVDEARLPAAQPVAVRGMAWSGTSPVERVDVLIASGPLPAAGAAAAPPAAEAATWLQAALEPEASPGAPRYWRLDWTPQPGQHLIVARAVDAGGNVQPIEPVHNRLGYANNAVHRVRVVAG
jgi:DMSO/TMAO reductase YedYZ molybdopterin-dependent catalytic subunit